MPCQHAAGPGVSPQAQYLPFWRFELELQWPGGPKLASLEAISRQMFGQSPPPEFRAEGRHLWVPAFQLLGTPIRDAAFKHLPEWIHAARLEVRDGKVPLGAGGSCVVRPSANPRLAPWPPS